MSTERQFIAAKGLAMGSGFLDESAADTLTAYATGGQANGTPITASLARFTAVATAGDSALMMPSSAGRAVTVINAHASNAMNVFPAVGESFNALAANTAISIPATKVMTFFCTSPGLWHTQVGA